MPYIVLALFKGGNVVLSDSLHRYSHLEVTRLLSVAFIG